MKKLLISAVLFSISGVALAAHHAKILTNEKGMTLYTFDKDSANTSNCYGGCASKWPPYIVKDGVEKKKGWSKVKRQDGTLQWAFNEQPLYTWVGDQQAGDTTGDGVKGVWHVAKKGHHAETKKKVQSQSTYSY